MWRIVIVHLSCMCMCDVCGVLCVVLVTLQYQSVRDLQGGSSRGRIVREHVLELHVALLM
jgi:hypothetical protein